MNGGVTIWKIEISRSYITLFRIFSSYFLSTSINNHIPDGNNDDYMVVKLLLIVFIEFKNVFLIFYVVRYLSVGNKYHIIQIFLYVNKVSIIEGFISEGKLEVNLIISISVSIL